MTPAELRDEGVFEVGRPPGTSVLFVVTEERVMLCHADSLPTRMPTDYLADVAIAALHSGASMRELANGLGVTEDELRAATRTRGYAIRPSLLLRAAPTRTGE